MIQLANWEIGFVKTLFTKGAILSGDSMAMNLPRCFTTVAIFLPVESTAKSCYLLSMNKFQAPMPGTSDVITIEFTNYKIWLLSPVARRFTRLTCPDFSKTCRPEDSREETLNSERWVRYRFAVQNLDATVSKYLDGRSANYVNRLVARAAIFLPHS